MNEAQASVLRTAVKCAAVIILFNGWPKIRKSHVFNQTVIQPSQAEDMSMRSIILELCAQQPGEEFIYFERLTDEHGRTDQYSMLRTVWEEAGKPDQIGVSVTALKSGVGI